MGSVFYAGTQDLTKSATILSYAWESMALAPE
jgi:hypothetical protein